MHRTLTIKILLFLCFLSTSTFIYGQSNHFVNINRQDGLSNNHVRTIYQDGYGFMWFGTANGLNRFDGKQIDKYADRIKTETTLNGTIIYDVLFTSSNKLLIASNAGLNRFNYQSEDFSQIEQFNGRTITNIVEDESKNIWIVTYNNNLFKLSHELNRIDDFNFEALLKNKLNVEVADIRIFKYDSDHFFVNIKEKGFYLLNLNSHELKLITDERIPLNIAINKVLKIDKKEFWLGTTAGIFIYKNNRLSQTIKDGKSNKHLNNALVNDLQNVNNNEIWIYTDGGGINVFNKKTEIFKYIKQNKRDEFSVNSNFLYSSYIAKDSTMWVGSINNGLSQLNKNSAFVSYKLIDLKDGVRTDYPASAIFLDSQNQIWIGSDGNGLYQFKDERVQHVYTDDNVKNITSINELYPNRLLIGTSKFGVHSLDVKNKNIENQFILHKVLDSSKKVQSIVKDANENIIISSSKGILIDKSYQKAFGLVEPSDLSMPANIYCSNVDNEKGFTLFGGSKGLYKFENNRLELILNIPDGITSIIKFRKNEYWLGTHRGLCLVNIENLNTTYYSYDSGLNSVYVHTMVQSNSKNLWIGNSFGISKFDIDSKKATNYTYNNGFADNEFLHRAAIKTKDGRLFLGGLKGILAFYPEKILKHVNSQKVVFVNLSINHSEIIKDRNRVSNEYIANAKELTFDHSQNVITIDYSTFEFSYPEKVIFSYKLKGFDEEWKTTKDRSLTFMNLKPGTYYLQVKASNTLGEFDTNFSSLKIVVLPAWWKTIWFRIVEFVALLIIIYLFLSFTLKREQFKQNIEFERKSAKEQKTLDENQLRFFTNLSHEIRTPLSLIISPIRSIISREAFNPENAKNLDLIEKNALRIHRLVNRGIDFRKTQFKEPELQTQRIDIVSFLKDLVDGFDGFSKVKNINLNFESTISERVIWMDQHMIETIFYNLLSNAFKYSKKKGRIDFVMSEENENILVKVKDYGVGMSGDDAEHIFERFFQSKDHLGGTGIGLALTKRFVEAHKGTIEVKSEKGVGTTFSILIPFGDNQNYTEKTTSVGALLATKPPLLEFDISDEKVDIPFKKGAVLIVEDEDNLRAYLKTNLSNNFEVIDVNNGKEAYELIQTHNFDIVISDVMMPEMDGLELCKLLKENPKTSAIPVILLTAKTLDDDKIKGYNVGVDAYVEKPFQLELLKSQISNLLERQENRKNEMLELLGISKGSLSVIESDEKFYTQVMQIIEKNINNCNFDIPLFASEIGMSKSQLYRRLKAATHLSINELILEVRMNRASKLLIHSKSSIDEISNAVGFKNVRYFSTSFKKKFKMTPTKYRTEKKETLYK